MKATHLLAPNAEPGVPIAQGARGAAALAKALGSLCVRAIRRFTIHPALPEALDPLRALMLNLRWSWHPATRSLFASIDPANAELAEQDPVALLGKVPQDRLTALAGDPGFLGRLSAASADLARLPVGAALVPG